MWQLESADMLVAYRCICDGARGADKYVQITHTNLYHHIPHMQMQHVRGMQYAEDGNKRISNQHARMIKI